MTETAQYHKGKEFSATSAGNKIITGAIVYLIVSNSSSVSGEGHDYITGGGAAAWAWRRWIGLVSLAVAQGGFVQITGAGRRFDFQLGDGAIVIEAHKNFYFGAFRQSITVEVRPGQSLYFCSPAIERAGGSGRNARGGRNS